MPGMASIVSTPMRKPTNGGWRFCSADALYGKYIEKMAEREGFEPTGPCGPTVFETVTIDHSVTSPRRAVVAGHLDIVKRDHRTVFRVMNRERFKRDHVCAARAAHHVARPSQSIPLSPLREVRRCKAFRDECQFRRKRVQEIPSHCTLHTPSFCFKRTPWPSTGL